MASLRPRRNRARIAASLVMAALAGLGARDAAAADWALLTGSEDGTDHKPLRPFAFTQLAVEAVEGRRVLGLTSPQLARYEGARPTFNTVGDGDASWGASIRRLRLGLRGTVPESANRVTYFTTVELGHGGMTRLQPVALADAAVSVRLVPGARLRLGQFKLPLAEEVAESNPQAADFIHFTNVSQRLLAEADVTDGTLSSGYYGFRDLGAEVFDGLRFGKVALSYRLMLSNGRMGAMDRDTAKDVSGRVGGAYVFRGADTDPHRHELAWFAWAHTGSREIDGARVARRRSGVGAQLELERVRARVEVMQGQGALLLGPQPSFDGAPLSVAPFGSAVGGYGQLNVEPIRRVVVGVRYEELHTFGERPADERVLRVLTPSVELRFSRKLRFLTSYDARFLDAPSGSEDAKLIARSMGDRIAAQLTLFVP